MGGTSTLCSAACSVVYWVAGAGPVRSKARTPHQAGLPLPGIPDPRLPTHPTTQPAQVQARRSREEGQAAGAGGRRQGQQAAKRQRRQQPRQEGQERGARGGLRRLRLPAGRRETALGLVPGHLPCLAMLPSDCSPLPAPLSFPFRCRAQPSPCAAIRAVKLLASQLLPSCCCGFVAWVWEVR